MPSVIRSSENPILKPDQKNEWEAMSTFSLSGVKSDNVYHFVYRAVSFPHDYLGNFMSLSTIGYGKSNDGIHIGERRQLFKPEQDWEKYGCEDPRITKLNNKYYIFYTALSVYPFGPSGIKIGLATTTDFNSFEKHPVTPFNAKAMALFPDTINGKIAAVLTADTDTPPSKIGIAFFDDESQIWSKDYWDKWYANLNDHLITLQRSSNDQIEVGAAPIKTEFGWLLIHSYIKDYFTKSPIFGIEAVLLDLYQPTKIIGRSKQPILVPDDDFELYGNVPRIVFPSGAILNNDNLNIYYSAADTTGCVATLKLNDLIAELLIESPTIVFPDNKLSLERFSGNPIIKPNPSHKWESKATFNPTAIRENNKVHIIYRAMSNDDTSVMGYASSSDGFRLDDQLADPIYIPRESFEKKSQPGNSGCEDARITKIGDIIYMNYTAVDAKGPTRIAMTKILVDDFINRNWSWDKPKLISLPELDDKNSCILPDVINGKYVVLHRLQHCIWIDYLDNLEFENDRWLTGDLFFPPRLNSWDSEKVGITGTPIKTSDGWLLIYHGLSLQDKRYRLGAALLALENPSHVISRLNYPILEPETDYENRGVRPATVFSCGEVVIGDQLLVYYGGADEFVCVASTEINMLLRVLKENCY